MSRRTFQSMEAAMAEAMTTVLLVGGLTGCAQGGGNASVNHEGNVNSVGYEQQINATNNSTNRDPATANTNANGDDSDPASSNESNAESDETPTNSSAETEETPASDDASSQQEADFSVQKAEFYNRLAECERLRESSESQAGSMSDMAKSASAAHASYADLLDDVIAFLKEHVLSAEDASRLLTEQGQWESQTESDAAQARDSQGPRSGFAMALDYHGVYLNAYPARIRQLIDMIPGGAEQHRSQGDGATADEVPRDGSGEGETPQPPDSSTEVTTTEATLIDGWYSGQLTKDSTATFPLYYIEPDGDYWNITCRPLYSSTEKGVWTDEARYLTDHVETFHMPVAADAELYEVDYGAEPFRRTDLSRQRFEDKLKPDVIQQMLVFHVESGQVVSAHLTCVVGV